MIGTSSFSKNNDISMDSNYDASINFGTPGTINTPMTANTVHTMDSSVGETYSNYNGETWRDKNSVHGSVRDEYSFDQDSLSNFSYSRSTRGTPLHPIHEISGASTSSAASKKEEEGLLQNDVSSFISPSMSKSSMSTPASVHEVKQQLQKEPEQIQPRPAGKDSESFYTHLLKRRHFSVCCYFSGTPHTHGSKYAQRRIPRRI